MSHYAEHLLKILLLPGILLGLLTLTRWLPLRRRQAWRRLSRSWSALSNRRGLSAALLCLPLILSVALFAAWHGVPIPAIHDEFSYLLAADTFASGRLTNPTHPMWVHFESFHIIHLPTYMSMYPPLQGAVLAVGILLGHPWLGVLLASLAAILLLWWAARQWLPPRWALLAGAFGALLFIGTYWTQSYWGGSVNAAAGAVVCGAAGMLGSAQAARRRPRTGEELAGWPGGSQSVVRTLPGSRLTSKGLALFAAGALLCAASRPFEGGVLCLFFSLWLVYTHLRVRPPQAPLRLSIVGPAVLVLLSGISLILAHNKAVTGHPLRLPYQAAFDQYFPKGRFLFEQVNRAPVYRHSVMQQAYQSFNWTKQRPLTRIYSSYTSLQEYYLGIPLFTLFILALPSLASAGIRAPILAAYTGAAALVAIPVVLPHYYAPFAAPFLIACVHSVRTLPRLFRLSRRRAWLACAAVLVLTLFQYGDRLGSAARGPSPREAWAANRARIERELLLLPGHDLVIVRYNPDHNIHREWVYNRAGIDSAEVVWARAMDEQRNIELQRYFASRRIWLLDADETPPRLTEFIPPPPQ
ncbi:MAG: hypothetical protein IH602_15735 [Bryobacteraceae bacterium]|nr:hypothetical protein [Bryobacteraceae bacterium]